MQQHYNSPPTFPCCVLAKSGTVDRRKCRNLPASDVELTLNMQNLGQICTDQLPTGLVLLFLGCLPCFVYIDQDRLPRNASTVASHNWLPKSNLQLGTNNRSLTFPK